MNKHLDSLEACKAFEKENEAFLKASLDNYTAFKYVIFDISYSPDEAADIIDYHSGATLKRNLKLNRTPEELAQFAAECVEKFRRITEEDERRRKKLRDKGFNEQTAKHIVEYSRNNQTNLDFSKLFK